MGADLTQKKIGSVKLYLSPILDMFNGEIISYNISRKPDMEQIYDMLDKAFTRFDSLDGLILHSDQGWQYQHYGYRKRLEEHHIVQSMSRKVTALTTLWRKISLEL
ncbi:MAG: DDE-type integrase/transposase/recombinase [Coprobacter fastidiosus]